MPPWALLGPVEGEQVWIRGREAELIPPLAGQVVEAKGEARCLPQWQEAPVLCGNACVLAKALRGAEGPVFPSGQAVLEGLTAGEIGVLSQKLEVLCARCDPGVDSRTVDVEAYKAALKADSGGRLRWKVLRAFRALPSEERVQRMRQRDYLYCALNLLLDQEEGLDALCPSCRQQAEVRRCPCCGTPLEDTSGGENPSFDFDQFLKLKKGAAGDE
jgi:hypothetical protein